MYTSPEKSVISRFLPLLYLPLYCLFFVAFYAALAENAWCRVDKGHAHCYQSASTSLYNYTEALAHCETEGGYLARIQIREEFDFVIQRLQQGNQLMCDTGRSVYVGVVKHLPSKTFGFCSSD